jgi:hypothetical protein
MNGSQLVDLPIENGKMLFHGNSMGRLGSIRVLWGMNERDFIAVPQLLKNTNLY